MPTSRRNFTLAAYRWRQEDLEFADLWDEAIENAVDAIENVIYQRALGGDTIAAIFYLKASVRSFGTD
jgi:hypothetical protein